MKLSKKIIITIILMIFIIIVDIIYFNAKKETENINQDNPTQNVTEQNETEEKEIKEIEEIKQETGSTANNELYEIQVEYDGKRVLNIKPEIQYKIAFAGIVKNEIPLLEEIDNIFENQYPQNTGIWIDDNSREKFLKLLDNNTNNQYEITEQGYLKILQEINPNAEDKTLNEMINSNKRYIITISGTYYEADRVTGIILDNFFEEMDPYQASKVVEWDSNIIMFLSTNKEKKLTDKELLQELTAYGK